MSNEVRCFKGSNKSTTDISNILTTITPTSTSTEYIVILTNLEESNGAKRTNPNIVSRAKGLPNIIECFEELIK